MKHFALLSALLWCCMIAQSQSTDIIGPEGSGQFGTSITVLPNGNYVITDPYWDNGTVEDVGSVYLYDGRTHSVISILTGSTAGDRVGLGGVIILTNGNYLIRSPDWNNNGEVLAGAVTWASAETGINGTVSGFNSLVGGNDVDRVGSYITVLTNGNYVVSSPRWNSQVGAVTWGNGITGTKGVVSSQNSLIGSTESDMIGGRDSKEKNYFQLSNGVVALPNGNYVVISPEWDNSDNQDAGAVTWGNGETGVSGIVNSSNSLVGETREDQVGDGGITVLTNGNYIVISRLWNNEGNRDVGAVTWAHGETGVKGGITESNSLIGSQEGDAVGWYGVAALKEGNYVVVSPGWHNGEIDQAGAVTWGNGETGTFGKVSADNSLVGSNMSDRLGDVSKGANPSGILVLSNGNYVVLSPGARAATWGDGKIGISGEIDEENSLLDTGNFGIALPNGNYVVASPNWVNSESVSVGAITLGDGVEGTVGIVAKSNSLTGSSAQDRIGALGQSDGIVVLDNGHFLVVSPHWDNGDIEDAGAITWIHNEEGLVGEINSSNSLVGSTYKDQIGADRYDQIGVYPLREGNYIVFSYYWDNGNVQQAGAVTWGNGEGGTTGTVSVDNSLVGSTRYDRVGSNGIEVLRDGNYVVSSPYWDNGDTEDAGAVTWGGNTTGVKGEINSQNSLVGNVRYSGLGRNVVALNNNNYVATSSYWSDDEINNKGAVIWGNGETGINGEINSDNSLTGNIEDDRVGDKGVFAFQNGNYLIQSSVFNSSESSDVGAISWGDGANGVSGKVGSNNSVIGGVSNPSIEMNFVYNLSHDYLLVGRPSENIVTLFDPTNVELGINGDQLMTNVSESAPAHFVNSSSRIITSIQASGGNPVTGDVDATVWVRNDQPARYVKRHFEVTPMNNPSTATGTLTLYFTQSEFNSFNAISSNNKKLPAGPDDAEGKANLLVEKRGGKSNDGSGDPSSYVGGLDIIDPDDDKIIWNETRQRWEVTFEVEGFSGFFIKTEEAALPVELLTFKATKKGTHNLLEWATASEQNNEGFEVERSSNAKSWKTLGFVRGNGTTVTEQNYTYVDENPLEGISYYRLKQLDFDGTYEYSQVVVVNGESQLNSGGLMVYPNPTSAILIYEVADLQAVQDVKLFDVYGKLVKVASQIDGQLSLEDLSAGVYLLVVETESERFRTTIVKE